jgi:16S rRNA (guanine527-N7)-methyltransferase
MRPDLSITLIDGSRKRIDYLNSLKEKLQLTCSVIHARSEELARLPAYRGAFGAAVSRAVAPLHKLLKFCLPLVRPGGVFIAMKGPGGLTELENCSLEIQRMNCALHKTKNYSLPGGGERRLIVLSKNK